MAEIITVRTTAADPTCDHATTKVTTCGDGCHSFSFTYECEDCQAFRSFHGFRSKPWDAVPEMAARCKVCIALSEGADPQDAYYDEWRKVVV